MDKRYIRAGILSALGAIVVILLAISVLSSDTSAPQAIASNLEKTSPGPGGIISPQGSISVDLADGFKGRIYIDGEIVPDDQLEKVESLGQYTFRPGKGQLIEQFEAGEHQAQVYYWEADKPEPTSPENFVWTFRVTS